MLGRIAIRLLTGVVVLGLVLALGLLWIRVQWQEPVALPEGGYHLEISAGDSLTTVSRRLEQEGVIRSALLLNLYGRYTGLDSRLHRGEYHFEGRLTAEDILGRLARGDVVSYQVTLPEGITLERAMQILAQAPALQPVLDGPQDARLLALAPGRRSPEGLFLPETYRYVRGESDWDILQRAHAALNSALNALWEERRAELPYAEPYDAVIMASIIERETAVPEERRDIAGVFVRRLERGMRLQTDPTVIYGLGREFDGNLTRAHLRDVGNPFNTYRHDGLPPTPIALPGVPALLAALDPAPGSALYFVARGDGSHVFSDTLEAHREAVRTYQLNRRADYRSTPEGP
jgi:UPF0755 protein